MDVVKWVVVALLCIFSILCLSIFVYIKVSNRKEQERRNEPENIPNRSISKELGELNTLRLNGTLSEDEFEKAKKKVLN